MGNAYAATGQWSEAEQAFTICTLMWQDSYFGYFQRGLCRLDRQHYEQAERDFTKALAHRPDLTAAMINRAVARTQLGKHAAALDDFNRALNNGATQTRIYFLRSDLRRKLGDPQGAAADYAHGLQAIPHDEKSWIKRGLAKLSVDPGGALDDFRQALRVNPRSHAALRNLAHIYAEHRHDPETALDSIDRLVKY